jgi:hypothetical protein
MRPISSTLHGIPFELILQQGNLKKSKTKMKMGSYGIISLCAMEGDRPWFKCLLSSPLSLNMLPNFSETCFPYLKDEGTPSHRVNVRII